jgi:hypothetical protein
MSHVIKYSSYVNEIKNLFLAFTSAVTIGEITVGTLNFELSSTCRSSFNTLHIYGVVFLFYNWMVVLVGISYTLADCKFHYQRSINFSVSDSFISLICRQGTVNTTSMKLSCHLLRAIFTSSAFHTVAYTGYVCGFGLDTRFIH